MLLKTLHLPNGDTIFAEVVSTPEDLARGLMFRQKSSAMFFVFPTPGKHPMWMANVQFPLDIAWLDWRGLPVGQARVIETHLRALPECPERLGGARMSTHALELPAGRYEILPRQIIRW